jgi:hypothetical protein
MRLFLDDTRPFPRRGYECVRDVASAKILMRLISFEFITLDYSLGKGLENGYDLLCWMKEEGIFVPKINIHSNNIMGKKLMSDFIKENFPETELTMNELPK